jgi:uncharacterized protein (DUF433 family)
MSTITKFKFLGPEPGSAWNEFVITGTGIRASTLAIAVRNDGRTPEQAAADFHVPVDAVLESMDYMDAHVEELKREIQAMDEELIRRGFMNPDGTWKSISTTTLTKTA